MRAFSGLVASWLVAAGCLTASGQNVIQDYWKNRPSPYKAEDPWVRGAVMQAQTGWAGLYFNCDGQEDKRFSPYLYWKSQPQTCLPVFPLLHLGGISQQYREVKQRIARGASAGVPPYDPPYGTSKDERTETKTQPPIDLQIAPPAPQPDSHSGQSATLRRSLQERRAQADQASRRAREAIEFSLGDQQPAKKASRR